MISRSLIISILVALLVGGFIGWGARSLLSRGESVSPITIMSLSGSATNVPADQLALTNLFVEHTALLTMYLQGFYDGKDVNSLVDLIENNNGQQIARFIGARYGWNAQNDFGPMWNNRLSEYKNYAAALKNNDTVGMENAKKNLGDVSAELGDYFHKLNQHISASQVANMMNDYNTVMLSAVYAYGHQNDVTMEKQIRTASDHATQFAAYLSQTGTPDSTTLY